MDVNYKGLSGFVFTAIGKTFQNEMRFKVFWGVAFSKQSASGLPMLSVSRKSKSFIRKAHGMLSKSSAAMSMTRLCFSSSALTNEKTAFPDFFQSSLDLEM